ncbi:hypothetical protein FIBSPDRAFT_952463 [Athelia psychrophila]|uniref:Uncharacterized protein n=1 Tax=Athelia psychrophila TaxID=1759441 RepID=A0A166LF44_9AGAM|nr:hypothetical protein FIBSPDRAFT_952463 [Fibularhizoctonia sp. CBS 109695]
MNDLNETSHAPVIVMLLMDGTIDGELYTTLIPLIQSIRGAHANSPTHILGVDPMDSNAILLDRYTDVEVLRWSPSRAEYQCEVALATLSNAVQALEVYASQIYSATKHLIVVMSNIRQNVQSPSSSERLCRLLQRSNAQLHVFAASQHASALQQTLGRIFDDMQIVAQRNSSEQLTYWATRILRCPSVASLELGPAAFSSIDVMFDMEDFQSESSASVLRESQDNFDWDLIIEYLAQNA